MLCGLRTLKGESGEERDGQEVHPGAEQREHGRQEGEGRGQGRYDNQDGAEPQRLEERHRNDEHSKECHHDGGAAEEHRAACRITRLRDCLLLVKTTAHLLSKARHDQQRVVDAHRKANHRDHHRDEEDQLKELTDNPHGSERQHYGDNGDPQRQKDGDDSAEEHQQNDQLYGDAKSLPFLQVCRAHLVVLESYAGISANEHAKVGRFVGFLDNVNDVFYVPRGLLRVAGQDEGQYGGLAVRGYRNRIVGQIVVHPQLHRVRPQRHDLVMQRLDHFLELRIIDSESRRLNDDQFGNWFRTSQSVFE